MAETRVVMMLPIVPKKGLFLRICLPVWFWLSDWLTSSPSIFE